MFDYSIGCVGVLPIVVDFQSTILEKHCKQGQWLRKLLRTTEKTQSAPGSMNIYELRITHSSSLFTLHT